MVAHSLRLFILVIIPFFLFGIAYWSKHKNKPAWFIRKLIHTFGLTIVGLYGAFLNSLFEVFLVLFFFLVLLSILSIIPSIQMFQNLISMGTRQGQKESESLINTTLTSISIFALLVVSYDQQWIFLAGTFIVAFGDGLGEFIGRPYGKHQYKITTTKSIEGSLGVFVGSLIGILSSFIMFNIPIFTIHAILIILLASLVSTILEAISVSFLDNVSMPWAAAVIFWLFL